MALTANREINRYVDQALRAYRVAGGAHVFKGAFVGLNRSTGYARALASGDAFVGIAYEETDATGASNGDKSVRVFTQGDFLLAVTGTVITSIGRPVFVSGDDALSLTLAAGVARVGRCIDVPSDGTAIVRIETLEDAQEVRYANVPLASLTSGSTTNPVMITHKPCVILSAEVIFNTKPDVGNLDVGVGNTTPNEIVSAFNLASLTNNTKSSLTLAGSAVAAGARVWARVGAATSTAGVGGLLTLRYVEMP